MANRVLVILRKSGMHNAKSISLSKMLPLGTKVRVFLNTFVVVLTALLEPSEPFRTDV